MSNAAEVITRLDDVHSVLAGIGSGLTVDVLWQTAIRGEQARRNTSKNNPVTAPGLNAYHERVCALRDQLLPGGWDKKCKGGSELTVSPDRKNAIVVASGDENTAIEGVDPKTKCPKGTRMEEAAVRNVAQYDLFIRKEDVEAAAQEAQLGHLTWVLLIRPNEEAIAVELSLVTEVDADGRPSAYKTRIILPSVPLDGGQGVNRRTPTPAPDVDVVVTRRLG